MQLQRQRLIQLITTQPTPALRRGMCAPRQQQRQQKHRSAVGAAQTDVTAASSSVDQNGVPPGCSRYSISVKKPLGLVLEQNKDTGVITIVEIAPEGNAAKTGLVAVGDQLIATSGVVYNKESEYGGAKVKMGQEVVRMTVMGESFKTVSAAIGSHPGHMEVKLEFQRC